MLVLDRWLDIDYTRVTGASITRRQIKLRVGSGTYTTMKGDNMTQWIRIEVYADDLTRNELYAKLAQLLSSDTEDGVEWEAVDDGELETIDDE